MIFYKTAVGFTSAGFLQVAMMCSGGLSTRIHCLTSSRPMPRLQPVINTDRASIFKNLKWCFNSAKSDKCASWTPYLRLQWPEAEKDLLWNCISNSTGRLSLKFKLIGACTNAAACKHITKEEKNIKIK